MLRATFPPVLWMAFALAGTSPAAVVIYHDHTVFLAATTAAGEDSYGDLGANTSYSGPLNRSAGLYGYSVAAGPTSALLYGGGDGFLTTDNRTDSLTFSFNQAGLRAVGGFFFGSDIDGLVFDGGVIDFSITTAGGTTGYQLTNATRASFVGFTTDDPLLSLTVKSSGNPALLWPSVDRLTLAAVPEPATLPVAALALLIGLVSRRR